MIYLACAVIRLDDATTVQIVRRNTTADLIEAHFNYITRTQHLIYLLQEMWRYSGELLVVCWWGVCNKFRW